MAYGRALTQDEAKSGQYAKNQVVRVGNGLYLRDNNQQPTSPPAQTYADFINQAFKNSDYQAAQQEANTLAEQAPTYLADKQTELRSQDPMLQQLNAERAKFTGDLYSTPFTARDQNSGILDPVKREALVAQAVGNVMGQLQGTQGLISQRQGTQDQLAQRAYDVFKAQLDAKQGVVSSLGSTLKDIATKGYEAKVKADTRVQDLADWKLKEDYSNNLRNSSNGDSNKKLTPAQVIALNNAGVPAKLGDTMADVAGQQPGNQAPKKFSDFVNEYQTINRVSSSNPEQHYNEYLTAQQNYNVSKDKAGYLAQLQKSAPDIAPLIKANVVSDNPVNALIAALMGQGQ